MTDMDEPLDRSGDRSTDWPEPWFKVVGMLDQNWAAVFEQCDGSAVVRFFDDHSHVFDLMAFTSTTEAERGLEFNGFSRLIENPSIRYMAGVPAYPLTDNPLSHRHVYSSGEYWRQPPDGYRLQGAAGSRLDRSLLRFIRAQDPVMSDVYAELKAGKKETHWMWFVFPQFRGLGHSQRSTYYGIESNFEARAYLDDSVLNERLTRCFELVLSHSDRSARDIFGNIDAMKLHACATLFHLVDTTWSLPERVLQQFYAGALHEQTKRRFHAEGVR